ncbi:MAG: putative thymidylate kinase [Methanoregulaceae archaeon PtaB.Bin056]|jgi:dTMP kinase|nr:MAG: putative thymidylate kinase [Methanoregulaceae archaeon PtaB.Bin056]
MVLITLEGIDGSGKSTLFAALQRDLADLSPVFTREPGATWIGDQVRRAIAEEVDPVTEALLFAADHAAHLDAVIRPALAEGKIVISDRYTDSRYAYQWATLEGVLPDPLAWLRQVHAGWTVPPDHTLLLVLPVEVALSRKKHAGKREHFEEAALLERVQEHYLRLAGEEPYRFMVVDAEIGEEELASFAEGVVRDWCGSSRSRHRR